MDLTCNNMEPVGLTNAEQKMTIYVNQQNEYRYLLNDYMSHIEREDVKIVFRKCCDFSFMRSYHKFSTMQNVWDDVNAYWANSLKIELYQSQGGPVCPREGLLYDYVRSLKPIYGTHLPVVYSLYVDDGSNPFCNHRKEDTTTNNHTYDDNNYS